MEILLTLKIGFLMVLLLPYLSEGQSVTLNMPSYNTLNSRNMRITCEFQTDDQFTSIHLLNGNKDVVVSYVVKESQFKMAPESNIRLEIESGTSIEKGSLTFVFSQLSCPDFTWYVCRGGGMSNGISVDSTNTTLQISPGIDSLMKTSLSDLVVNQISSFVCRGTVRKEGPFSLQWYRRTLTTSSQLQVDPARVIGQNECSRSISSSLNYNVSETDGPNLVLWCRIESGQRVDKMVNFTVQEISTIAAPFTPQPVKAGLEPGSIVGIVLGVIAIIVLVVLLVWFLVVRPKRLKAAGSSKDKGPEPNAKDYQEDTKGQVNPALEDKHDADNAPYTVYAPSKYDQPSGGHSNPAMDQDMPNHLSGSTV